MGQIVEDFENGWPDTLRFHRLLQNRSGIKITQAQAKSVSHSLLIDDQDLLFDTGPLLYWEPTTLRGGTKPNFIEFWFYEVFASNGFGVVMRNDQQVHIGGFGTTNPDWIIYDANEWSNFSGTDGGYDEWIRVRLTLDWPAGTFDVTGQRAGQNAVTSVGHPLVIADNVADILIGSLTNSTGIRPGFHTVTYFDQLTVSGDFTTYRLSGEVLDEQTGGPLETKVRAYRWDNGEYGADAQSSPADGSFTITGLLYDVPYMVVSAPPEGYRPRAHGPITPDLE